MSHATSTKQFGSVPNHVYAPIAAHGVAIFDDDGEIEGPADVAGADDRAARQLASRECDAAARQAIEGIEAK